MKKFFTFIILITIPALIFSSNYKVNDAEIDNLFKNATEISINNVTLNFITGVSSNDIISIVDDKDPLIAWLCTFSGYIGICGIHRLYLGTELITFIAYFITGGGCGYF